MLAAGVGQRLGGGGRHPPKVLLSFGGKTLLRRHVEILSHLGVAELTIATGYRALDIEAELAAAPARIAASSVYNPDYLEGSLLSLWSVRETLVSAGPVVLMDGDVLYDYRLMERLLAAPDANCFAMDRELEPGEEPVKLCLKGDRLVDFHKTPTLSHDRRGEWVGFLRLSPEGAKRLVAAAKARIDAGERETMYEEAIRDALLADPGAFGVVDVTDLPWIEIDFAEDVQKAKDEILPRLKEPGP